MKTHIWVTGSADVDDYLNGLLTANLSKGTVALYSNILKWFLVFIKKDIKQVVYADLEAYNQHLSVKVSPCVHKMHLIIIRKYLKTREIIPDVELKKLRMPRIEKKLPEYLTKEQAAKLLNAMRFNLRDYAIVSTFLYTGVRCTELVNLDVEDIKFQEEIIKVRHGKGAKDRIIPLAPQLKDALRAYLKYRIDFNKNTIDGSKALFVTERRPKRICQETIRKMLIIYGVKAEITHLYPHKLRHSALTEIYQKSKDLYYTAKIAGHSNPAITQIYAHIDTEYLKEIYKKSNISFDTKQQPIEPKPEPQCQKQSDSTGYQ